MFRILLGALASVLLSVAGAVAGDVGGYKLIDLNGHHVKWGAPVLGVPARVSYAFATEPVSDAKAYNCGRMMPLDALLSRSDIPPDVFRNEVAQAFRMWEVAAGISFQFTSDPARADILIGAQAVPRGFAYTNVSYAETGEPGIKSIGKSRICLNPERRWKVGFDGNLQVYDIRYTVAHEIGHAIGLDHPGRPEGELMGFRYGERHEGLQPGDLRGAHVLYGVRVPAPVESASVLAAPKAPSSLPVVRR